MNAALRRALQSPRVLFWTPTLIWGSTWHVILYQIDQVPPAVAVAWRFAIASLLLFALAAWRGPSPRLPWRWHGALAGTGALQYGVNYWCVYEAERYLPSGLVAVLFSLMVFGNALGGWWMLGQRVSRSFLAAGAVGVVGVALIFWPEVMAVGAREHAALGLAIGITAVVAACCGNAFTLALSRRGLALTPMLAWCMGYGALGLFALAWVQGHGLAPGHGAAWWASLGYLAVFGTVVAFLLYFRLGQRFGPATAALTGVLTPPIALAISAALEGWRPTVLSIAGCALALASVYAATRPAAAPAPAATAA